MFSSISCKANAPFPEFFPSVEGAMYATLGGSMRTGEVVETGKIVSVSSQLGVSLHKGSSVSIAGSIVGSFGCIFISLRLV